MSDRLAIWLDNQAEELKDEALRRAPSLLPDETDLRLFLTMLRRCLSADAGEQLGMIQAWIVTNVGDDAQLASDWIAIARALKDVLLEWLPSGPDGSSKVNWRRLDRVFSHVLVELARQSSDPGYAKMVDYMADLRREMDALEQSKSNFMSVAAHELKTPLTILEGYANMLRSEIDEQNQRLHLLLDGINNGTRRLRSIIEDMVDAVMLDNQAYDVTFQVVHLEKVIKMAAESLADAYRQRDVALEVGTLAQTPTMYGDAIRLYQAIRKVLENGLKYTPDGGRVSLSTELVRQDECSHDVQGYVDIIVADSGIGIAAGDLESIFNIFVVGTDVTLHSSSKTRFKGGGPGLGLPIARGIVAAHGGRIWAESPGADETACPGSTFHIELPVRIRPPAVQ